METRNLEEENEQLKIKLSQANAARQHIEEKLVNLLSRDGNYMATRLLAAEKAILNQRFELARLNKALAKKRRAMDVLRMSVRRRRFRWRLFHSVATDTSAHS